MGNNTLSPKVLAATVAAALSTLVLYVIETAANLDLPVHVEGALLTLLVAAATFIAGYQKEDERG